MLINRYDLPDTTYAAILAKRGISVHNRHDIPAEILTRPGFGGAERYEYTSPLSGQTLYVIERAAPYSEDGFACRTLIYDAPVTDQHAAQDMGD